MNTDRAVLFHWSLLGVSAIVALLFLVGRAHAQSVRLLPGPTTVPSGLTSGDQVFLEYCRSEHDPSWYKGCGFWLHRWVSGDANPVNELFLQADYHPALLLYNSAPDVSVIRVSRSANVVTIHTAAFHSLVARAKVIVRGVGGCTASPNGSFNVASTPSRTQFTYVQSGPDEECTPVGGTAQGGARASILFQHNNASNRPEGNWMIQADRNNDRQFGFFIAQKQVSGDPDAWDRLLFLQVNGVSQNLGVGTALQSRVSGNTDVRGYVKSEAFVNDTTGRAAFALKRTDKAGGETVWITNAANRDIAFAGDRNWSWPYWRFYNDGTGRIAAGHADSTIPVHVSTGLSVSGDDLVLEQKRVARFGSRGLSSPDVGLSRAGPGVIAVGDGGFADTSGEVRAARGTFAREVTIGGGTPILGVLSITATLDFADTLANTCSDSSAIALPGAAEGDAVSIGVPAVSIPAGGTFFGYVSAPDTVKVRFCADNRARNPSSGTFRIVVTSF